jgi:hypothetical protein
VQYVQGLSGPCRDVDDVAEPSLVLEVEVCGILQVDVGLRRSVEHQRPAARAVGVGDELRDSAFDPCRQRLPRLAGPAATAAAVLSPTVLLTGAAPSVVGHTPEYRRADLTRRSTTVCHKALTHSGRVRAPYSQPPSRLRTALGGLDRTGRLPQRRP